MIADDLPPCSVDERQRIDMRSNPVWQRLAPGRLGTNVAGRTKHRDKHVGTLHSPVSPSTTSSRWPRQGARDLYRPPGRPRRSAARATVQAELT